MFATKRFHPIPHLLTEEGGVMWMLGRFEYAFRFFSELLLYTYN